MTSPHPTATHSKMSRCLWCPSDPPSWKLIVHRLVLLGQSQLCLFLMQAALVEEGTRVMNKLHFTHTQIFFHISYSKVKYVNEQHHVQGMRTKSTIRCSWCMHV